MGQEVSVVEVCMCHATPWGSLEVCSFCLYTMRSHVGEIWHMLFSGFFSLPAVVQIASVLHSRLFLAACHVASRQLGFHVAQRIGSTLQHLP